MTGEAARAPLARAMQLHPIKPHLHAKALGVVRHRLLGWKQGKLPMSPARFVERFNLMTPRFALAIIDLTQIQKRPLHHPTARTAPAFDNAPVTVFLAVLPSPCESQVHGPRFYAQTKSPKEGRSSLHTFPPHRPLKRFSFRRQNSKISAPVGKVGLRLSTGSTAWARRFAPLPTLQAAQAVRTAFRPRGARRSGRNDRHNAS